MEAKENPISKPYINVGVALSSMIMWNIDMDLRDPRKLKSDDELQANESFRKNRSKQGGRKKGKTRPGSKKRSRKNVDPGFMVSSQVESSDE